jgi:hypothetical protein
MVYALKRKWISVRTEIHAGMARVVGLVGIAPFLRASWSIAVGHVPSCQERSMLPFSASHGNPLSAPCFYCSTNSHV